MFARSCDRSCAWAPAEGSASERRRLRRGHIVRLDLPPQVGTDKDRFETVTCTLRSIPEAPYYRALDRTKVLFAVSNAPQRRNNYSRLPSQVRDRSPGPTSIGLQYGASSCSGCSEGPFS